MAQKVLLQVIPELYAGGVERGTIDIAKAAVDAGYVSLVASSGGRLVPQLAACGATHIELPLGSRMPWAIKRNAGLLKNLIEEHKVDIVHARSRAPAWSAFKASRKTGAHFVTTFHGLHSTKGLGKKYYNSVMGKGERVIAVSNYVSEHIQKTYGTDPQKIRVIHRGVDMDYFDPQKVTQERMDVLCEKWRIENDRPIIFLPGRITRWKGQDFLLRSLSRLREVPSYYCIMAGDCSKHPRYYNELMQQVMRMGLEKNVRIVDAVEDMPAAYMLSSVVVSASQRPEAFGRVAVEAQAMGKPVVVTAIGGSKETVINGKTGRWVDPTFTQMMAEGVQKGLLLSGSHATNIAATNRQHIQENFSLQQMCNKTLAVYEEILSAQ